MTKREEIADELLRLTADYRHVYDGGYAEVRGIREWANTLDAESRLILWDRLLEAVASQEAGMWGVGVAVLVGEHPDGIAERLDHLLAHQSGPNEWKNEIMFSLLCLGYRPAPAKCFTYIEEGLLSGRDEVLRLLAASCRVDPEKCLTLSSEYFGRVEVSKDEYRSIIPTFVRHFMAVDERLLWGLVQRAKTINEEAGKLLAAFLDEYFTRTWNIRELGETRVDAVRERIGGCQSHLKTEYPH